MEPIGKYEHFLSVKDAIQHALLRHQYLYNETPALVLVGPEELSLLLDEIKLMGSFPANTPISIFNMMIVPKCSDGIDFQVSCGVSQLALLKKKTQIALTKYN